MTIKEVRKALGLSQVEFGHLIGYSPQAISRWELGLSKPKTSVARDVANKIGIVARELFE